MKNRLKFLILLMIFACDKNEAHKELAPSILGKWNLESYESSNGEIQTQTYIIFMWYESGFEFLDESTFYPRHGPPNKEEWLSDYDNGPGSYEILNEILTLSYQETSYDYSLNFIGENKIEISNYDSAENPWTGKWILVRE